MDILIRRGYVMEVAHQLVAGVPDGHRCRRLHGHRYEMAIMVGGPLDEHGMVVEYDALDAVVDPLVHLVDHHCLNTLMERNPGSPEAVAVSMNPTVERLLVWFKVGVEASLPQGLRLVSLHIFEDGNSAASWNECLP